MGFTKLSKKGLENFAPGAKKPGCKNRITISVTPTPARKLMRVLASLASRAWLKNTPMQSTKPKPASSPSSPPRTPVRLKAQRLSTTVPVQNRRPPQTKSRCRAAAFDGADGAALRTNEWSKSPKAIKTFRMR